MSNDAKLGMDVQDMGRVDDSELFPVKVGDVVKVKALCETVSDFFLEERTNREHCLFSASCEHIICEGCNESEFTTTVVAIIDCGQGWKILFGGLAVEGSLSDYGKSFWKIEDEEKVEKKIFCREDQIEFLNQTEKGGRRMTKEDQIAEMAAVIYDSDRLPKNSLPITMSECLFKYGGQRTNNAVALYDAGYRKQEWISVEERLPEHLEKVLVCDELQNMKTGIFLSYDNGGYDWCTAVRMPHKITHWMPLPEPPKMKGGN